MVEYRRGVYVIPTSTDEYQYFLVPSSGELHRVYQSRTTAGLLLHHTLTEGSSYLITFQDEDDGTVTVLEAEEIPSIVKARTTDPPAIPKTMITVKVRASSSYERDGEMYALAEPVGEVHFPNPNLFDRGSTSFYKAHVVAVFDRNAFVEWLNVDSPAPVGDEGTSHVP